MQSLENINSFSFLDLQYWNIASWKLSLIRKELFILTDLFEALSDQSFLPREAVTAGEGVNGRRLVGEESGGSGGRKGATDRRTWASNCLMGPRGRSAKNERPEEGSRREFLRRVESFPRTWDGVQRVGPPLDILSLSCSCKAFEIF